MSSLITITTWISLTLVSTNIYGGGGGDVIGSSDLRDHHTHSYDLASENKINYDISAEIWGEAGRLAYTSAAKLMEALHPKGKRLPNHVINTLYPIYGRTVSNVRVHWNAEPLDEWASTTFRIELEGTETIAQTFGYDIYMSFDEPEDCYEGDIMRVLTHEIIHSQQFEKFGWSFSNFGYNYFKKYKLGNLDYDNNDLEIKAYERERDDLYSCDN